MSAALDYQWGKDRAREARIREAVEEIYRTFGFGPQGGELTEAPVRPGDEEYTDEVRYAPGHPSGSTGGPYAYQLPLAESEQVTAYNKNQEAWDNKQLWDKELSEVYDAVMARHRPTLDRGHRQLGDRMTAQLLRQGMGGSHLQNQYKNEIDKQWWTGLGQIDSMAQSASEKAKSGVQGVMNNAIAQVHADNFEAANAASLNQNIANSIESAQSQATSQNIGNMFEDLANAYERRQNQKGATLANQSYYDTAGSSGTVSG